jgi:hypothetical protein
MPRGDGMSVAAFVEYKLACYLWLKLLTSHPVSVLTPKLAIKIIV